MITTNCQNITSTCLNNYYSEDVTSCMNFVKTKLYKAIKMTYWLNVEILRPGSCSFRLCHFISMDMTDMQRSQRCQICDSLSIFLYHNVLQLYLVVYNNVLDNIYVLVHVSKPQLLGTGLIVCTFIFYSFYVQCFLGKD